MNPQPAAFEEPGRFGGGRQVHLTKEEVVDINQAIEEASAMQIGVHVNDDWGFSLVVLNDAPRLRACASTE